MSAGSVGVGTGVGPGEARADQGETFGASWSLCLRVMTALSVVLLTGVAAVGILVGPWDKPGWLFAMVGLPLAMVIGGSFFRIKGYVLTPQTLFVRRPGWSSKVDLRELRSAEANPDAMSRSVRICGNGGLFCFSGAFWSRKMGSYRAFATAPKLAVVLKFPDRTVVVTPDRPAEFVEKVRTLRRLQGGNGREGRGSHARPRPPREMAQP